jgi:hypothetical protein
MYPSWRRLRARRIQDARSLDELDRIREELNRARSDCDAQIAALVELERSTAMSLKPDWTM